MSVVEVDTSVFVATVAFTPSTFEVRSVFSSRPVSLAFGVSVCCPIGRRGTAGMTEPEFVAADLAISDIVGASFLSGGSGWA